MPSVQDGGRHGAGATARSPVTCSARAIDSCPSFGPTQPAVTGSLGHTALWGHVALGLAWPGAFAAADLLIFRIRTRTRTR